MKDWILSRGIFWSATFAALLLYGLTVPDGLPWGVPISPNPIWGHFVRMFAGHNVVLACVAVSFAAGTVAALAFRFFGWRVAVGAALAWMFAPAVWNRAITGDWKAGLAAAGVFGVWLAITVGHRVFRKAREAMRAERKALGGLGEAAPPTAGTGEKLKKWNRRASWGVMGAGILFALASLTAHDYRLGEAASAYARGVVAAAGGRIIVMDGLADDQIVEEAVHSSTSPFTFNFRTISLIDRSPEYRDRLAEAVRLAFPAETNLWAKARVGAAVLAEAIAKAHPDRLYAMDGRSTTLEAWERRWEAFKPYLGSSDPFVPFARRAFAYEGNRVANDLASSAKLAWQTYVRIYEEVDPGNFSALVNMSEMIRLGHPVGGEERKRLLDALERFFRDPHKRAHAREIARNAGPIRVDPGVIAKLEAEAKRRVAEKVAAGEKVETAPEMLTLVEWNNEMVRAMDNGDLAAAGRIARTLLSNEKWQDFIPANAVMGSVAAVEGDFVASEAFFQKATASTTNVPLVVWNDYADVLMHLGKPAEAEEMARRAVEGSGETFWVARLTLAQALSAQKKNTRELRDLCRSAVRNAPTNVRERVRTKVEKLKREAVR